ncbi:hypothetical protein COX05_01500 [candidate division WWE3 bacterium CG22_combo_CG10-13_8_21_14_all_39_12]|uniref:Calcineurin-like phosphoesterase domain-containing protein n=2 Tax=Katanobacteria TaxID=422282 RepID=A0A2M7X0G2_UNCKA|nr:MAG: hypothetical protein COX05_01500 [candidate division WWE3 bacterium CG22_combo_CG10-13_8_21_14_all_39_12]PJA39289.1 MAG: hypothetical protein CO179_05635 [candidate division WWE3 bacterium CG_4_9_14_3_um_filter_39_7]
MKTIVISDIHLDEHFNQQKFDALSKIFIEADRIIINGDFWDGYLIPFDKFINSQWSQLFPFMKDKTIYMYGNHDAKKLCHERVAQFSHMAVQSFELETSNQKFHIEHGNKFMFPHDENKSPKKIQHLVSEISNVVHSFGVSIFGPKIYRVYSFANQQGKKWARKNLPSDTILVCGHTHLAEDSRDQNFINTGFNFDNYLSWLEITDTGFGLKQEKY